MKRVMHLTPGEFELMSILWQLGEGSVKQVLEKVSRERNLAYTTVMTVLDKLRRKGIVHYRKKGRAYLYKPAITRDDALGRVIDFVVETYFEGSRRDFVHFIRNGRTAAEPVQAPAGVAAEGGMSATSEQKIEEFLL